MPTKHRHPTRRRFIQQLAAVPAVAGVGYVSCRASAQSGSPNEKLNIGIIGVGGRGGDNMGSVAGENIVALCDVDERNLAKAAQRFGDARRYHDFRKMLDNPAGLDAVVVSTTDHTHACANVLAMRQGLHVYSEKPLGHSVQEAAVVRDTYLERKDKIATQMGTQIHATDNYRRVVELIQLGAIGKVSEAHVWCNRHSSQATPPPPEGTKPAPDYLHWDLWIGPAPDRGYADGYHPGNLTWNRYWDIGNGILGDMGSHLIDLPYWALDLQFPATCQAEAPEPHPVIYPRRLKVSWEHARHGEGPHEQACKVVWYDGDAKPNELLGVDVSGYGIGVLFVGEKGKLLADYGRRSIIPNDGEPQNNPNPEKQFIPKSPGHHREWINACKGDPTTTLCNFDYSGRLIAHNLLGCVSHRVGNKKLMWDHKSLKATNAPEADQYIRKEYREGWKGIIG